MKNRQVKYPGNMIFHFSVLIVPQIFLVLFWDTPSKHAMISIRLKNSHTQKKCENPPSRSNLKTPGKAKDLSLN